MAHANVNAKLTLDDKQHSVGLKRAEGALTKFGRKAGSVLEKFRKRVMVAGLAVGGLGALIARYASGVEESLGKFNAVFKEQAGGAEEWAKGFAGSVGRSVYDIQSYMATLQDTFVPLGFARTEAAELSKQLTKLSVDLASFNNASEPETVQLLTSAIVGNHEAVRRFGVVLTAATVNAKLLEMGITGGSKAATEQQKALARLKIIMASTTDAQGDAKRTAGSFANQMRALKADIGELAVAVGEHLLPHLKSLVQTGKAVVKMAVSLTSAYGGVIVKGGLLVAAFSAIATVAGPVVKGISAIVKVLIQLAKAKAVVQALSGPKGWAALAAGAAVAAAAIYGIDQAFASMGATARDARLEAEAAVSAAGAGPTGASPRVGSPSGSVATQPLVEVKEDPKRRLGEIRHEMQALGAQADDLRDKYRRMVGRDLKARIEALYQRLGGGTRTAEELQAQGIALSQPEREYIQLVGRAGQLREEQHNLELQLLRDEEAKHQAANATIEKLELEAKLLGKSADEQRRLRMEAEGFSQADIERVSFRAGMLESATKIMAVEKQLQAMREKNARIGMTEDQRRLRDLKQAGATQKQLAEARILMFQESIPEKLAALMGGALGTVGGFVTGDKEGGGFQARTEDLLSHHRRLQAAAASKPGAEKGDKVVKQAVDRGTAVQTQIKNAGEQMGKTMLQVSAGINELVKRGIPGVAG